MLHLPTQMVKILLHKLTIPQSNGVVVLQRVQNVLDIVVELLEFPGFLDLVRFLYISHNSVELETKKRKIKLKLLIITFFGKNLGKFYKNF